MKGLKNLLSILCASSLLIISCEKETAKIVPVVETAFPTAITANSVNSGGLISSEGGASVSARGVCWSTSQFPTVADSKTSDGSGKGSFTSSITGLSPGVTYYVRAYAVNAVGTGYGNQQTFTTATILATLTTTAISSITPYTAVSGGNITADGGAPVTARGVCWGTSENPTILMSKSSDGTGTGTFTSNLTDLIPGTTYYVRAYAVNSIGTSYGNQQTFVAPAVAPTVATSEISSVASTSASGGGVISSTGGGTITAKGICWSTNQNPTTADFKTSDASLNILGANPFDLTSAQAQPITFSSSMTALSPGTTYYVRAYATNSAGTSYGEQVSFTTLAALPTISTTVITGITSSSASGGGNITNSGGANVTARGVCWSTSQNPVITGSKTTDGNGTGTFTSSITGLLPGTTYYVRAYATNSAGTEYGEQRSFTTLADPATVVSAPATSITSSSFTANGGVTADGGSPVTEKGVCWATTENPTVSNNKVTDGNGTGLISVLVSGLQPGQTYYYRPYAINGAGTAYGTEISVTTVAELPIVVTTVITSVGKTGAVSGGTVTSDGGATVSSRGVCWSTGANPTTDNSKTSDGTGSGIFTSTISGLLPGTTYFVRAYATNSAGTAYGVQGEFTTLSDTPVVTTSAVTEITNISATCGGNVTISGGEAVTARGVCWSTSENPTTDDSKTSDGTGTGQFSSSLTGLSANTTYYIRSYATNSKGTAYGTQVTFTTTSDPL